MSMHEIEYLVSMSIKALDACEYKNKVDLRSMFHHLFQFHDNWDTGFTRSTVMDILIKHHFTYQMTISDHPDYHKYKSALNQIVENYNQNGYVRTIRLDPTQTLEKHAKLSHEERVAWEKNNPPAGYHYNGYLYADAGSLLWKRMVEVGLLTGTDAIAPDETMTLVDVGDIVVRCAEMQQDYGLMVDWYAILTLYLWFTPQARVVTPSFESMIATIYRNDAIHKAADIARYREPYLRAVSWVSTASEYLTALEATMQSNNFD